MCLYGIKKCNEKAANLNAVYQQGGNIMKNNPLKKSLSVFLAVLMLLTSWVWVAPEKADAAATLSTYRTADKYGTPYWDGSDLKIPLLSHRFEPHHPVVVGSPCWDRTNAQLYQPCARVKVWSLNRLANGLYLLICGWGFAPHINPSLPSHSYQIGSFALITGRWIWTTADSNEWCSVYYCSENLMRSYLKKTPHELSYLIAALPLICNVYSATAYLFSFVPGTWYLIVCWLRAGTPTLS